MGLATDTTVYFSRREEARKVNRLTFTIRASDSSWHPGLSGRHLFPARNDPRLAVRPGWYPKSTLLEGAAKPEILTLNPEP